MRHRFLVFSLLMLVVAATASAQATRTWVSGVGDDVNPCSRTAPCKTFAGAISKTASGGIIDALDPGGFGAVTITKPMTIEGTGTLASILSSGVQGVIVNITSGTNRNVVLREILINGAGTTLGTNGINFIAGDALLLEDVSIQQYSGDGIFFQPNSLARLGLRRTSVALCQTNGVHAKPVVGGVARVEVFDSYLFKNGNGFKAEDNTNGSVEHSVALNNTGDGVLSLSNAGGVDVLVDSCEISHNGGNGVHTSGGNAALRVTSSILTGNAVGATATGGVLATFQDNVLVANTSNGAFNTTLTRNQ